MNKNIQSFLKFAALPAFLLTVLPALFLTSCGGGGDDGGGGDGDSNSSGTKITGIDLIPDDFAVSLTSVVKGDNVTLSSKVKNQGTADSGAVTITFYKSTDGTITPSADTAVEVDTSIASLDGGALSAELSTMDTEDTAKSVFYGACVVTNGDTDTSNDCTAGLQVTFTDSASADLVADQFGVAPSTIAPSGEVVLSVMVRNSGSADSVAETLTYYSNTTNSTVNGTAITGKDATVDVLTMGATQSYTAMVQASGTAGTYYYYACVTNTGGTVDCSDTVEVTVNASDPASLQVSLTVDGSGDPATVTAGMVDFVASVSNEGDVDSVEEALSYYRSTTDSNNPQSSTSTKIGSSVTVAPLGGNGDKDYPSTLTVIGPAGIYYYFACVTNTGATPPTNCGNKVEVTVNAPNLQMGTLTVNGSSTTVDVVVGSDATFAVTVTNRGNILSAVEELKYYRSASSAAITSPDTNEILSPEQTFSINAVGKNVGFKSSEGIIVSGDVGTTYHYYACVNNTGIIPPVNCSNKVAVSVTAAQAAAANLTLGTLTVNNGSTASITEGGNVDFAVTVTNSGTATSVDEILTYYSNTNNNTTGGTAITGTVDVTALSESGTIASTNTFPNTKMVQVSNTAGMYYYYACVTNTGGTVNCSNTVAVTVNATTTTPDPQMGELTIADDTISVVGILDENVVFSVQVENIGGVSSVEETLQYYRSENSNVITSPDGTEIVIGETVNIPALSTNEVATGDKSFSADGGVYYYYACLTSTGSGSTADSNLTNNCSNKVKVIVLPAPDLTMGVLAASPQDLNMGGSILFSVRVNNIGSALSAVEKFEYYRSDNSDAITSPVALEAFSPRKVFSVGAQLTAGNYYDGGKSFPATSPAGVYYYYVCVTSTSSGITADSNPDNNCSNKVMVNISSP